MSKTTKKTLAMLITEIRAGRAIMPFAPARRITGTLTLTLSHTPA